MAIDWSLCADPKVKPSLGKRFVKGIIARCRARKARADAAYAATIRVETEARDGYCRYGYDVRPGKRFSECHGESQWAHLWKKKRSATRGLPPELRHSRLWTVMLCARHHEAEERHRLLLIAKTARGADGPLRYRETK